MLCKYTIPHTYDHNHILLYKYLHIIYNINEKKKLMMYDLKITIILVKSFKLNYNIA